MKNRSPRITKTGILICLALFALAVAVTAVLLWHPWKKEAKVTPWSAIHYYPVDYEADIFQNRVYLSYNRDLFFGSPFEESQYNYEADRESCSGHAAFFLDYFHALITGDEMGIRDFFVEDFFEEPPHFTMQMIHDIRVILNSESMEVINGEEKTVYNYTVSYEIFQNNGTWRVGVGSNQAIPQVYQVLCDENGDWKIYRILEIEYHQ